MEDDTKKLKKEYEDTKLEQVTAVAKFFDISFETADTILDFKYWPWLCRRQERIKTARTKWINANARKHVARHKSHISVSM